MSVGTGLIRDAIAGSIARHRERTALVSELVSLSYGALGQRILSVAQTLRTFLPAGARVGFCLSNRVEYVVQYAAVLESGGLPFLLDANFNVGEIQAISADCALDALVVDHESVHALQLCGVCDPICFDEGVVVVLLAGNVDPPYRPRSTTEVCRFTSGTTGRPKCLEFSGEAVHAAAVNWIEGTGMANGDRTLCLAALSNGLAFNTSLLSTLLVGGELHFLHGPPMTRRIARRIERDSISRLVGFPAVYRNFTVADAPLREDLSSLRHAISAGAPLSASTREAFHARYAVDISDYYGIAETGPCTFERDMKHGAGLGTPLPGAEIRIASPPNTAADTGEILIRTTSMTSGYLNYPDLLQERIDRDGFYRSGDRGQVVAGRLHLVGRTEDYINVAGRKIDATEIAAFVSSLPGVADAAVFPDEDLNQDTVVHLVVVATSADLGRSAILKACRARLAPWKAPGRISFVDAIPRNGIGKPRIALLRQQLKAGIEARNASPTAKER